MYYIEFKYVFQEIHIHTHIYTCLWHIHKYKHMLGYNRTECFFLHYKEKQIHVQTYPYVCLCIFGVCRGMWKILVFTFTVKFIQSLPTIICKFGYASCVYALIPFCKCNTTYVFPYTSIGKYILLGLTQLMMT